MYRERFSTLKHLAQSPAHYWYARNNRKPPSAAMTFGSLVHALVLGGTYYVFDGKVRNGKAWESFQAETEAAWSGARKPHESEEPLIVRADELDRATAIAEAVNKHPTAAPFLVGRREHYIEWDCDGVPFRSTLDVFGEGFVSGPAHSGGFIADLKTTTNAEPSRFSRHAQAMMYHAQLACYRRAVGRPVDCYLIAAEINPPYDVTVHRVSERALEEGDRALGMWLERRRACDKTGEWPGYTQAVCDLDLDSGPELIFEDET